jgi:hypothetical protein
MCEAVGLRRKAGKENGAKKKTLGHCLFATTEAHNAGQRIVSLDTSVAYATYGERSSERANAKRPTTRSLSSSVCKTTCGKVQNKSGEAQYKGSKTQISATKYKIRTNHCDNNLHHRAS